MKNLFTITVSLIISNLLFGQTTKWVEAVYLKNGSVIRGIIIEQVPNKTIKIQTRDKSVFVFSMDEVDKIVKEEITEEGQTGTSSDNASKKESGFSNITEVGGIFGVGNSVLIYPNSNEERFPNETKLFSITTINGYQIKRRAFIGFGAGAEVGKYAINVPLFLDVRHYFLKKGVTPFLAYGAGYAFRLKTSQEENNTKDGALAYTVAGVRIFISQNTSWVLSFGYRLQHSSRKIPAPYFYGEVLENMHKISHFLTLRTGFTF
ncbi:MAG: hypothetical protein NZM15_03645 [Flavobacteriales bacterium]|nr:hypothetical protein [Flavobacteriales bacterium]MDW8431779.1 hypothetical protein [Flavobacteriales bacterium]